MIVLHDNLSMNELLAGGVAEHGFYPHQFSSGTIFLNKWNNTPERFEGTKAMLIHKDIGHRTAIPASEIIKQVRTTPEGSSIRTIVASGEFSYRVVCTEAKNILQADAGYDPTYEGILPDWGYKVYKNGAS